MLVNAHIKGSVLVITILVIQKNMQKFIQKLKERRLLF